MNIFIKLLIESLPGVIILCTALSLLRKGSQTKTGVFLIILGVSYLFAILHITIPVKTKIISSINTTANKTKESVYCETIQIDRYYNLDSFVPEIDKPYLIQDIKSKVTDMYVIINTNNNIILKAKETSMFSLCYNTPQGEKKINILADDSMPSIINANGIKILKFYDEGRWNYISYPDK